jgi:hypothetical protein
MHIYSASDMTFSITAFGTTIICHYAGCHYAECRGATYIHVSLYLCMNICIMCLSVRMSLSSIFFSFWLYVSAFRWVCLSLSLFNFDCQSLYNFVRQSVCISFCPSAHTIPCHQSDSCAGPQFTPTPTPTPLPNLSPRWRNVLLKKVVMI